MFDVCCLGRCTVARNIYLIVVSWRIHSSCRALALSHIKWSIGIQITGKKKQAKVRSRYDARKGLILRLLVKRVTRKIFSQSCISSQRSAKQLSRVLSLSRGFFHWLRDTGLKQANLWCPDNKRRNMVPPICSGTKNLISARVVVQSRLFS